MESVAENQRIKSFFEFSYSPSMAIVPKKVQWNTFVSSYCNGIEDTLETQLIIQFCY
jgi:hypothetical protein